MLYELAYPMLFVGAKLRQTEKRIRARLGYAPRELAQVTYKPDSYYRVASWRLRKMDIEILMRVAPMRAARLSIERFEKTKRQAIRPSRTAVDALKASRRSQIRYKGKIVVFHEFGPGDGPIILALHGWNGFASMLAPLAKALGDQGFRVLVPDLPGHGESEGTRYSFYDLGRAAAEMFKVMGPIHGLVGHSAGGLIGMMAISQGLNVRHLVTIGSPASLAELLRAYLQITQMPMSSLGYVQLYYGRRYGVAPSEVGPELVAARRLRTLVLHEESDWQVGKENALAIASAIPGSELVVTKGLTHMNMVNSPLLHDQVASFLRSNMVGVNA